MFKNILLATDFSPRSAATRALALSLAREQGARVAVLHVYPFADHLWEEGVLVPSDEAERTVNSEHADEIRQRLEEYAAPLQEAGIATEIAIRDGRASEGILQEAAERRCDLVILGSHSRRTFLDGLLGGTAAKVSQAAKVPVLIVSGVSPG